MTSSRKFAIGKQPETAEEWAEEIMACWPGLSTAAPLRLSNQVHRLIVELVRGIQKQCEQVHK